MVIHEREVEVQKAKARLERTIKLYLEGKRDEVAVKLVAEAVIECVKDLNMAEQIMAELGGVKVESCED